MKLHEELEDLTCQIDGRVLAKLKDLSGSINGLQKLNREMGLLEDLGEAPDFWSRYYEGAISQACQYCASEIGAILEGVEEDRASIKKRPGLERNGALIRRENTCTTKRDRYGKQ